MSVLVTADAINLEGRCLVEDAETLLFALQQNPGMRVNIAGVQRLHLAVAQVLLAVRPPMHGAPADPFISHHVFGRSFDGDKSPKPA